LSERRAKLADELRRLRLRAGLSTYELGRRLGISQSKISKIENGRAAASIADVMAWADSTGAADNVTELAQRAEDALTEAVAWRGALPDGDLAAKQHDVMDLERSTNFLHAFQLGLVPGLLQTAAYSRAVFLAHEPADPNAVGPAVAARMDRQDVLWDETRQFEFLIAEEALRWRPGSTEVMLSQIDRIRNIATLANVAIGIIPLDARPWVWHTHSFTLFEAVDGGESLVHVEMLTAGLNVTSAEDVAAFQAALEKLRSIAVFGAAADENLRSSLDELRSAAGATRIDPT
jgi:transcriptional regulator with XRE-family HTH domain